MGVTLPWIGILNGIKMKGTMTACISLSLLYDHKELPKSPACMPSQLGWTVSSVNQGNPCFPHLPLFGIFLIARSKVMKYNALILE